jgi:UDP-N-acetylmuramate dehydrogenase
MITDILDSELGTERVKEHKNISPYITLRTATVAEYYFEAESREDIQKAYLIAKQQNIPFFMLGGGSNLAITKDILKGLVVRNLYQKKEIEGETADTVDILFSSGYSIARVVSETTAAGYSGFEYHLGLPGTLGGGIYMNSKWTKPVSYIGDSLIYANLLDKDGKIKKVDRDYFKFAYDYSILHETKEIVLEAVFKLQKQDPEELKKKAKQALMYRHETQVVGKPTAGCFFQNIEGRSVGKMLDEAGLKNTKVGSYVVSDQHANFIINTGEGKPEDLHTLLEIMKSKVKQKYGVDLKEEVVII